MKEQSHRDNSDDLSEIEDSVEKREINRHLFAYGFTVIFNLLAGLSILGFPDSEISKLGGSAVIFVSFVLAFDVGAIVFSRSVRFPLSYFYQLKNPDEYLRQKSRNYSTRKYDIARRNRIKIKIENGSSHIVEKRNNMLEAALFYGGLLVGSLGVGLSVRGIVNDLYASTFAGSIIACVGFVTLACALISAEQASRVE